MTNESGPRRRWVLGFWSGLAGFFVTFVLLYLVGAYAAMLWDPAEWHQLYRWVHAYVSLASGLIVGVVSIVWEDT